MPSADSIDTVSRIGAEILAPLLSVWAVAAMDRLRRDQALHAVAVLRDGALAQPALARLAPDLAPRTASAWLSRRHVGAAAIADADDHENLLNLLVRMRHRPARWGEAAAELGLPPPDDTAQALALQGETLEHFWAWLRRPTIAAALSQQGADQRGAILAHLDQRVPTGAPLLLLDVGYAGTVQRCLKRIHTLAGRPRPIHGLYLLTSSGAKWAMAGAGEVRGLLAHLGEPAPTAALLLRHRDVLEALLAPPWGELDALTAAGDERYAASPLPPEQLAQAAALQRAGLECLDADTPLPRAQDALLRLLTAPTADEANLIGPWRHADSTALDGLRRLDDGPGDGDRDLCLWPAAARWRNIVSARGD